MTRCIVVRYSQGEDEYHETMAVAPEVLTAEEALVVDLNDAEMRLLRDCSGNRYYLKALEIVPPETVADLLEQARADAARREEARKAAEAKRAENKKKRAAAKAAKAAAEERRKFEELRAKFGDQP